MQIISLVYMKQGNINASVHFPTYSQAKLRRNQSWRHLPYILMLKISLFKEFIATFYLLSCWDTCTIKHNSETTTEIVLVIQEPDVRQLLTVQLDTR